LEELIKLGESSRGLKSKLMLDVEPEINIDSEPSLSEVETYYEDILKRESIGFRLCSESD